MTTLHGLRVMHADLPAPGGLDVFSTTRDFSERWGKDQDSVATGLRELLALEPGSPIIFAEQVHGGEISNITRENLDCLGPGPDYEVPACDGLITNEAGLTLVVRTADCVPVVVCDSRRPFIAALHAGWRGSLAGILHEALSRAISSGSRADDLWVWIGPHISRDCYEVSLDLAGEFDKRWGHLGKLREGRHLDLDAVNTLQALSKGIGSERIRRSGWCTFDAADLFPSFRRDGECRGQIYTVARLKTMPQGR